MWKMEGQEGSVVHAVTELAQEEDSPVTSTQADFTKNVKLLPPTPVFWAGRKEPLSMG